MHRIYIALILALTVLGSCSTVSKIASTVETVSTRVEQIDKAITTVRAEFSAFKRAADTNKDGKTTMDEWGAWLIGGGAVSIIALVRKLTGDAKRVAESDALKADTARRVNALENANAPRPPDVPAA